MAPRQQKSKSRSSIDEARVVATAVRLAKQHGVAKLSVQRVAEALKVPVASVKRLVPTRTALIEHVHRSVIESVPGLAQATGTKPASEKRVRSTSEQQIIDAALAMVRDGGVEALSMRGLARKLGLSTMGLYHHFPSKEQLLERLWSTVLQQIPLPTPDAERWDEQLRDYATTGIRLMASYPGLLKFGIHQPPNAAALRFPQHAFTLLTHAGFDAQTAMLGLSVFHLYALGTLIATELLNEMRARRKRGEAIDLSALHAPRVDLEEFVAFGTRVLIAGLRAQRATDAPRETDPGNESSS